MVFVKKIIKKLIKYFLLTIKNPKNFRENISLFKISIIPRFKKSTVNICGADMTFPDSASFLFTYDEIFKKRIYDFKSKSQKPYIIDGGANIGLASIFFKKIYPNSEIITFEPDAEISKILKENLDSFGFGDVKVIQKGLWKNEGQISFVSDGADGGRIDEGSDSEKIEVTRLKDYLQNHVDFLKLDIEGSEVEVMEDCKDYLHNIDNIFLEYHSFKNKKQDLDKVLKIFSDNNFRYYIQTVGIEKNKPFIENEENLSMDMQLNIFATKN
jgi:FkbM family methyltransferase